MQHQNVPGSVVHYVPAATRNYIGCPSIVVLSTGVYVASHSYFGNGATNSDSFIYQSDNKGQSWSRVAEIHGQIWSKLFAHDGKLYIMGTDYCDTREGRLNGKIVIRKSEDAGRSWSDVEDAHRGLLTDDDGFHTAPTAVLVHNNRLWKGFEFTPSPDRDTWRAFVLSASVDSDLLDRDSWTFSERMETWPGHQWIEGNVVVSPQGEVVNLLRTNNQKKSREGFGSADEPAALIHVSEDGKFLEHDSTGDRIPFPGGGAKFTIRRDPETSRYFALVNPQNSPELYRNVLSLSASSDLINWRIIAELIRHPDPINHAFQYVDWDFDGDDIVYVSRTAYDDDVGGAHNAHDANFLTFGRITDFRSL